MKLLTIVIEEELMHQNATQRLGLDDSQRDQLTQGLARQIAFRFDLRWKGARPHVPDDPS